MSFLNDDRFRHPRERKASNFKATIKWRDDDAYTFALDREVDMMHPERLRYLPQQHIEQLCGDLGKEASEDFQAELEKVIFSHVDDAERLGTETLTELIAYRTEQIDHAIEQLRQQLHTTNKTIVTLEKETSDENLLMLQGKLKLAKKHLEAHEKQKPKEAKKPTEDDADRALAKKLETTREQRGEAQKKLDRLQQQRKELVAQDAALDRIQQGIKNLQNSYERFLQNHGADAATLGIVLKDIVSLNINSQSLADKKADIAKKQQAIEQAIGTDEEPGLAAQIDKLDKGLKKLQRDLTAPERAYQAYCDALEKWEKEKQKLIGDAKTAGSVQFFEAKVRYAQESAPKKLQEEEGKRELAAKKIFAAIQDLLNVYRSLYRPIDRFIDQHEFISTGLGFAFSVTLNTAGFQDDFLSFIHKAKTGSFYHVERGQSLVERIVAKHDFSTGDGVLAFIDDILQHLREDRRAGKEQQLTLESQLVSDPSPVDLYNFLYGLSYLKPEYALRMAKKELIELSPGERGIILLVFYLLIDRGDTPLIIDQPEENLDNESVFRILVKCIREAKERRQVVIVTHNPNLVIACDAEQIICAKIDKSAGNRIEYQSGSIENPPINLEAIRVLEGTWPAFRLRDRRWQEPA